MGRGLGIIWREALLAFADLKDAAHEEPRGKGEALEAWRVSPTRSPTCWPRREAPPDVATDGMRLRRVDGLGVHLALAALAKRRLVRTEQWRRASAWWGQTARGRTAVAALRDQPGVPKAAAGG